MRGNSGSIRLDSWPTEEGQAWVSLVSIRYMRYQAYMHIYIHTYNHHYTLHSSFLTWSLITWHTAIPPVALETSRRPSSRRFVTNPPSLAFRFSSTAPATTCQPNRPVVHAPASLSIGPSPLVLWLSDSTPRSAHLPYLQYRSCLVGFAKWSSLGASYFPPAPVFIS